MNVVQVQSRRIRVKFEQLPVFGGGSEVETRDLMVNVNVPLYSGGAVSAKRRAARL